MCVSESELFLVKNTEVCIILKLYCCYSSDFCSVTCDNVTGSVGEEATFTCRVSEKCAKCCIVKYKFQYPDSYKDSAICKLEFNSNSCEKRNSFTCSYTPTTAMTEQFRFFLQTKCEVKSTGFTVNITGTVYNTVVYHFRSVCRFIFQSSNSGLQSFNRDHQTWNPRWSRHSYKDRYYSIIVTDYWASGYWSNTENSLSAHLLF